VRRTAPLHGQVLVLVWAVLHVYTQLHPVMIVHCQEMEEEAVQADSQQTAMCLVVVKCHEEERAVLYVDQGVNSVNPSSQYRVLRLCDSCLPAACAHALMVFMGLDRETAIRPAPMWNTYTNTDFGRNLVEPWHLALMRAFQR
jgi:hypothetical protein